MNSSRRGFLNTTLSTSTLVAMGSTTIPTFLGRSALAARGAPWCPAAQAVHRAGRAAQLPERLRALTTPPAVAGNRRQKP